MNINDIRLLPADPACHFAAIAALVSTHETEPSTEQSLTAWYERQQEKGILFTVAVETDDRILGFNGIYRGTTNIDSLYGIYITVDPAFRRQGLGNLLYDDLLAHASEFHARTLRTEVRDDSAESIHFAIQHGFVRQKHSIEMMFDLQTWDGRRIEPILETLRLKGFQFTSMAELGDTQEARRKLYVLNNSASATDPGSNGIAPWATFEEFEKDVCSAEWYRPDGQIVAIDKRNGEWAAMSAITVFHGADHAYNLFTGTDVRYRGRKLAQAVKSLALRKAREYGVTSVRTSHNSENAAMIAIDTKLGYVRTPGRWMMEKKLSEL